MKSTLFLICFCTLVSANAQVLDIDSVTVYANRLDQSLYKSGRSITVLTAREIQSMPVSSVDELLRYVAGVNLNVRGPFGVQTDIGMRGSTFSQVLVVLDNVRINDPLTGHFNNNIPVSLYEIERIEILRGPASNAFGSDAVGGMIHIITKTFAANKTPEQVSFNGQMALGEHNLSAADFSAMGGLGKFIYSVGYRQNISTGDSFAVANDTTGLKYNNFFDIRSYTASVGYIHSNKLKITARAGRDIRNFKAKYFYTASPWDDASEQVNTIWYQSNAHYVNGAHKTILSVGHKTTEDSYLFNPLFGGANEHSIKKFYSNINHTFTFNKNIRIVGGIQSEQRQIKSNERGDHKNSSTGYYLVYAQSWRQLHFTGGLRFEQDDNFGHELVPQLSFSYIMKHAVLRASYNKAIRGADFTERFISSELDSSSLFAMRNIGQAGLKAEQSHNFDFGIMLTSNGYTLDIGAFQRNSTDLIDYVVTNSADINDVTNVRYNTDYLYAQNIAKATTQGIEAMLTKTFVINPVSVKPVLSYTYLKTSNADSVVSKYLANHPKHNINLTLLLNSPKIAWQLSSNYIIRSSDSLALIGGAIPTQYQLINTKISYKIAKDKLAIYLQINNLFDTNYQEILGAQMPGRWMLYGIKWNL